MTKPSMQDIALSLAAAYAPDLLPEQTEQPEPEAEDGINEEDILWGTPVILQPGLDFHDGIVFMTFPLSTRVTKTIGKGKAAKTVTQWENKPYCVTSTREIFPFTIEQVLKRGFHWPLTFVAPPQTCKWAPEDIQTFLQGKAEEIDPFDLFTEIRAVYQTYVEFPEDWHNDLMTLFLMGSYMFKAFAHYTYIHFNGTSNAGKTQNLDLLKALAFNTRMTSNMTSASLFRTIAAEPGVVLFDEAESWESERGADLLSLIKSGYKLSGSTTRLDKTPEDKWVNMEFPTYSPKVLASVAAQDHVLTTRCIVINMRPAFRTIPSFDTENPRWTKLRNKLYLWAMQHTASVREMDTLWTDTTPDNKGNPTGKRFWYASRLTNRPWEIAHPILVMADYIGGETLLAPMYERLAHYWEATTKNQQTTDKIITLLKALPRVLQNNAHDGEYYYPAKVIHQQVMTYLDEEDDKYYKTRTVVRHLQTLGFANKKNSKAGIQIQIIEDQLRHALRQRRIEPFEEDLDWFENGTNYQHAPIADAPSSLWTLGEQNNDNDPGDSPWLGTGK